MAHIEFEDDEMDIDDLIEVLWDLKKRGSQNVMIELYHDSNGTTEDGTPEFEFTSARLVVE